VATPSPMSVPANKLQPQLEPSVSEMRQVVMQREAETKKPSLGEFVEGVMDNDYVLSNLDRIEEEQGFKRDFGYVPPSVTDEKAWDGVDPTDRETLFNDTRSGEHFAWLKDQYRREREVETTLASAGLWSIPGRIALNMLDPVSLVTSIGTGGLGIMSKSTRIANAVRAGLVGGATNLAIEGAVAAGSPTLDTQDALIGGLVGFALAAPMGAAISRADSTRFQTGLSALTREARAEEIVALAAARGEKIDKKEVFDKLTNMEAPSFGHGSAGAAKAFTYDPVRNTFVEAPPSGDVGQMAFGQLPTYAGVLRGHKNETVRNTFGSLVDDPIGTVDGSVSVVGATQEKARLEHIHRETFNRNANRHFDAFLARTGQNWTAVIRNPQIRAEFMEQAGRWAKYGDRYGEPNVAPEAKALAADVLDRNFDVLGRELQDVEVLDRGVKDYIPRRQDFEKLDQFVEGTDPNGPVYGLEQIEALYLGGMHNSELFRAIRKAAGEDVAQADRAMRRIVKNFVRRSREVGRGIDVEMVFGINPKSPEYVRELILEYGGERDIAEWVEQAMQRRVDLMKADDAGKPAMVKHRMEIDEGFGMHLTNTRTYERDFVRVADLYDNNIESLFNGYVSGASGRIAGARVSGFKTDADFALAKNKVRAALPDENDRETVVARADEVWRYLTGRPMETDPDNAFHRAGRFMRNYNMSRVGWSFGIAQIADMGNVVAVGGWKVLFRAIPEIRELLKRGKEGQLTNKLARELNELAGVSSAFRAGSLYGVPYDDVFGKQNYAEFLMRGAARMTAKGSGMAHINEGMQMLAAKYTLDGFATGKFPAKRLAHMGLSESEAEKIQKHLLKVNGGTKIKDMGIDQLDPQLRYKLLHAIRKNATRAVQENDWGSTFPFMHKSLGKILVQFRTFGLVALSKQSLHLIHQRDATSVVTVLWGLLFGGLSYLAHVAATKPVEEWDEHTDLKKIAAASFSRSGWASMLPMAVDTPLTFAGFDPLFSYRNSGLPSNAFAGIPTVEAFDRASRLTKGVKDAVTGEAPFSQKDAENVRRLAPVGTIWGLGHALNAIGEELGLPEE
jgi:hypothetical protein